MWECCNDEVKGTINAEQEYIYISIHRRSLDLRLNLQHTDIWMDMQACHGSS